MEMYKIELKAKLENCNQQWACQSILPINSESVPERTEAREREYV